MNKNRFRYAIVLTSIAVVIIVLVSWYYGNINNKAVHETSLTHPAHLEVVNNDINDIHALTDASTVIAFLKAQHRLPDYYITKREARRQGWNAASGNLCDVLPGKAIGGDIFSNREHVLPSKQGRVWHEADVNYDCGTRNADRLLYSSDGLLFITKDHYKTFPQR